MLMDMHQITNEIMELRTITAELQAQVKTLFTRSTEDRKLLESVHSLAISVERLAGESHAMRKDVDNLQRTVSKIEDKPADNWRTIVKSALSGIVGALVGAAMLLLIK